MINWKREGYKEGQRVFIVNSYLYTDKVHFSDAEVTYVGTKTLKVKLLEGEKVIQFTKGSHCTEGRKAGLYHYVYKNKEEYDKTLKDRERYEAYKEYLIRVISNDLSLYQLEKLDNYIDELKEGKR